MRNSTTGFGWCPSRPDGFTLVETLVASALFGLVITGIYLLYANSHAIFTRGETQADLQQHVRIALERMGSELRMAGFGATATRPSSLRPAIFEAGAGRIGFRADLGSGRALLAAPVTVGATMIQVDEPSTSTTYERNDSILITDGEHWQAARIEHESGNPPTYTPATLILDRELRRAYPLGSAVYKVNSILYRHVPPAPGRPCDPGCRNCTILREVRATEQPAPRESVPQPLACSIASLRFRYHDILDAEIPVSDLPARLADIRRIVVTVRASGTAGGRLETFTMAADVTPRNLRE